MGYLAYEESQSQLPQTPPDYTSYSQSRSSSFNSASSQQQHQPHQHQHHQHHQQQHHHHHARDVAWTHPKPPISPPMSSHDQPSRSPARPSSSGSGHHAGAPSASGALSIASLASLTGAAGAAEPSPASSPRRMAALPRDYHDARDARDYRDARERDREPRDLPTLPSLSSLFGPPDAIRPLERLTPTGVPAEPRPRAHSPGASYFPSVAKPPAAPHGSAYPSRWRSHSQSQHVSPQHQPQAPHGHAHAHAHAPAHGHASGYRYSPPPPMHHDHSPARAAHSMPSTPSATGPSYHESSGAGALEMGPKIWTGVDYLPQFLRAAEVPGEGLCYFYDDGTHCKAVIDGEQVNPFWGVTKAGKPRKRLAIACMTCREKKIKCDPEFPRCVQCEKFGRVCRFKNAPRGGNNGSPGSTPAEPDTMRKMAPLARPPPDEPRAGMRRPLSPEPLDHGAYKRARTDYGHHYTTTHHSGHSAHSAHSGHSAHSAPSAHTGPAYEHAPPAYPRDAAASYPRHYHDYPRSQPGSPPHHAQHTQHANPHAQHANPHPHGQHHGQQHPHTHAQQEPPRTLLPPPRSAPEHHRIHADMGRPWRA